MEYLYGFVAGAIFIGAIVLVARTKKQDETVTPRDHWEEE